MKKPFLSSWLLVILCSLGVAGTALAQGIVVGTISPASLCAGRSVSIPFSTTGVFAAGNTFTAQLSDATGAFPTSPISIGTVIATPVTASTLTITGSIPSNTASGTTYQIRVIASSPSRTSTNTAAVSVTSVPTAPGVTDRTYCQNATATPLSASAASGASLNWYTAPTGGTASSIAPTPSTSSPGSTPYYVSQSINGCESTRATLTVVVTATPGAPAAGNPAPACQGNSLPALTATPASGGTLLWYGTSQTGGTPSTTAPVPDNQATATYYVGQSVGSCVSTARAAITVTIKPAPARPAVATAPEYCVGQTASALSASAVAGATLNWYGTSQTGGTSTTTATVPGTGTAGTQTYYVSQTLDGCESPRAGITVTVKTTPGVPFVTSPIGLCQGQPASALNATPSTGATLLWYGTSQTGGTSTTTATVPQSTTPGSTLYYVSQALNGCEGPRASIAVTVNTVPGAPTATPPTPACQGSSLQPLTASTETGATLLWYGTSQTGGTSTTTATVPGNQASATYYVSQIRNGCESGRTSILVTIKPTPASPAVASAPSYCPTQTAAALSATPSANGTLNWYGTSPTGGSASTAPTVPNTSAAGTLTYYVSQTIDGCEGPRAGITVTVKPKPGLPSVTAPGSLCQNRTATALSASPSAGGSLNWYGTSPTGGTASNTPPVPPTDATGSSTYYVSQTVNGCEGDRASITATVYAIPGKPAAAQAGPYCTGEPAAPLSATGASLLWYNTNATGGAGSPVATTPSTGAAGTTTYYVTQTVSGCESERTGIDVRVKPTPDKPSVSNADFCQNYGAPTLAATASTGATLNWFGESASGGTRTDTPPAVPNGTARTYTYYVSQTLDGCESGLGSSAGRASITVRVKPTPGAPSVSPIGFCNNGPSQQLTALGSNIRWYDASGNALAGAPTPPTTTVGDQIYRVTQTTDGCESLDRASLVVTIKPLPAAPGVSDLTYCQIQQDQPQQAVGPLTAAGQNLRWYNPDGNAFNNTPVPTINQTGTQTYQVSQNVNGCEGGKATLRVVVNTTAAPSVAKSLLTYCINDKATPLQATAEAGGSLRWIDPYNRITPDAPTPLTQNSNVTPGGDPFYVYQIGANGCYSPRSTIRVVVNVAPTLSLIGSTDVRLGNTTPLKLSFTGAPPFSYTLTDGYAGTSLKNDTTISVLPRGNTTYQVISVTNSCGVGLPGNPATAVITVVVPTIQTSPVATATLCAGTLLAVPFTTSGQFTNGNLFTAELISVADTSKRQLVSPNGSTGAVVTAALPTTLTTGQYYIRVNGSNPGVGIIGANSPTVLTIRARPSATLTGTQAVYEGMPATLTVTFGGEGPWTLSYADSLRSYSVTAASSPYALEVRPVKTTTYRLTDVGNNCGTGPISGTATVTVQPVLATEDPALGPLVAVFPVPTTTVLTVRIDAALVRDPAVLTLTDASGRPALSRTTRQKQTELDLSQQPAGVYFLTIQVGDRQTVRRLLKQ